MIATLIRRMRMGDPFKGQPKQINTAHTSLAAVWSFTSRNLTPIPTPGYLHLTFKHFLEVIRKGTDFDLKHPMISPLLQVMPWPVYQDMTDRICARSTNISARFLHFR